MYHLKTKCRIVVIARLGDRGVSNTHNIATLGIGKLIYAVSAINHPLLHMLSVHTYISSHNWGLAESSLQYGH